MLAEYFATLTALTITVLAIKKCGIWSMPSFAFIIFTAGFFFRILVLQSTDQSRVFRAYSVTDSQFSEYALIGLLAFGLMAVGIVLATVVQGKPAGRQPGEASALTPQHYRVGQLLFAYLVGLAVQVYLFSSAFGGLSAALQGLSRRSFTEESIALATGMTPLLLPIVLFAIVDAKRQGQRKMYRFALLLFGLSLPWFAITNGRAIVIVAAWAFALTMFLAFRKRTKVISVALTGVLILVTSVVGLAWRASAQRSTTLASELSRSSGDSLFIVSDSLPIFDHMRMGIQYAEMRGQDGGMFLFHAFSVLVPRSVWPDKPLFLPTLIGRHTVFSAQSGLPPGLLGEGYIAAGALGVVGFALAFGVAVGLGHRMIRNSRALTPLSAWLVFLVVNMTLIGLRSGAQGALITLQVSILFLPVLLVVAFIARVRPAPLPRRPQAQVSRPLSPAQARLRLAQKTRA